MSISTSASPYKPISSHVKSIPKPSWQKRLHTWHLLDQQSNPTCYIFTKHFLAQSFLFFQFLTSNWPQPLSNSSKSEIWIARPRFSATDPKQRDLAERSTRIPITQSQVTVTFQRVNPIIIQNLGSIINAMSSFYCHRQNFGP